MLFIVVSLLIPFLVISGFGNTITKVFVVLAGAIAISLVYLLLHYKRVFAYAKENWVLVFKSENFLQVQTQPSDTISDSFLDKMVPPFSMLTLREYLFGLGLVVLYVLGFYFHLIVLRVIVFVCLLLFFFWKKEERSWFVTILMLAVIVAGSYNFYFSHYPFIVDFFLLPIVYQLTYGKRIFIIPSAVAIVAIMAISVLATHDYLNVLTPLPMILVFFGMRYKFGWVLALLYFIGNTLPILSAGVSGFSSHTINTGSDIFNLISFAILAYAIAKKRDANFVSKILLLIAFAISVLFFPAPEPPTNVVAKVVAVTRSINTNVTTKTENRPINFVENCIDYVNTPRAVKLGTSFEILGHYLGKTVVPYPLSYYYGYSFIRPMTITDTLPAVSLVLHILLLLLALCFMRKDKRLSYGIFIYLLAIATFSNYLQPVPGMIGDRFLLIPSLGWVILLVVVLQNVFRVEALRKEAFLQALSPMAKYVFLAVLSIYSVLTFARNRDWNDWFSLFRHDIKYVESSAQAHNLLALRLMKDSYNGHNQQEQLAMYQEALIHFKRAVEIYPQFFNATYDVARVYTMLNVPDSALSYYNRASELSPTFSESYNAAGEILFQKNRFAEARAKFEKIITIFPDQYVGYEKVSFVYFIEKEYAKSLEVNKLALQKVAANPQPYIAIAKTFHAMNQDDSTRYYLKKALEIAPSHPEANSLLNNLPR
jgi:tetratricopeptide (TPR) repeat protein